MSRLPNVIRLEMVREIFGAPSDGMAQIEDRASWLLGDEGIVWEGDAQTFQFLYVGRSAERILGYPVSRWLNPGFWATVVVHPDDQRDAIAYCALATGQGRDHDFEYRAQAADGRLIWLHDLVTVIRSPRGPVERLRGIMIDVTAQKSQGAVPVFSDQLAW